MNILQEAGNIVSGGRDEDYGHYVDNLNRISIIVSHLLGKELTPKECALFMIGLKLARQVHKHKRDKLVDLCGYAHILNELEEIEENK